MSEETKPLLLNNANGVSAALEPSDDGSPPSSVIGSNVVQASSDVPTENSDSTVQPAMGPENSASKVTCRVCQAMIDVTGKRERDFVKCNVCDEATPIRSAPPGLKYVRCSCNYLLVCKRSSQLIACPRASCKRVINLAPYPVIPAVPHVVGMNRVTCVHCQDTFVFNMLHNSLARCPHCRKVSSVGPDFAKANAIFFLLAAVILIIVGIGFAYFTYSFAMTNGGYFAIHIAIFVLTLFAFWKCLYYCRMKVSSIDGPL